MTCLIYSSENWTIESSISNKFLTHTLGPSNNSKKRETQTYVKILSLSESHKMASSLHNDSLNKNTSWDALKNVYNCDEIIFLDAQPHLHLLSTVFTRYEVIFPIPGLFTIFQGQFNQSFLKKIKSFYNIIHKHFLF